MWEMCLKRFPVFNFKIYFVEVQEVKNKYEPSESVGFSVWFRENFDQELL